MNHPPNIRRRFGSSIDFDWYRQHAAATRRQAMQDSRAPHVTTAGSLVVSGVLGLVLMAGPLRTFGDRMAAASLRASPMR